MSSAYDGAEIQALQSIASTSSTVASRTSASITDFAAGYYRTAGGKVSIAASGTGYFCLTNPAGSGKIVTLQRFTLAADNASDVAFQFDTVLASPTSLTAFRPNRDVAGSTVATAATSTAAPTTAGTSLSPIYRLGQNIPVIQNFTVVLAEGQSVAAVLSVGSTATAFYAAATWTEV